MYLNALGGVPERDDVRFNLALKEIAIPAGGQQPDSSQFPSLTDAEGANAQMISDFLGNIQGGKLLTNASFAGHTKWTDPAPTTIPRDYKILIPAACDKRYLIRLVPKRFCFDQSNEVFGSVDHTTWVDVSCGP
jgi:hypothetical protein